MCTLTEAVGFGFTHGAQIATPLTVSCFKLLCGFDSVKEGKDICDELTLGTNSDFIETLYGRETTL